jgi:voltage-gated potassium channel
MSKIKQRLYDIFEKDLPDDKVGKVIDNLVFFTIMINIVAVILESVAEIKEQHAMLFWRIETVSVVLFTVEYLIRVWVCDINEKYRGFWGRIKYILTPMALVDLFAILPFYLPLFFRFDLRFLRVLRMLRLLRVFKLGRYSSALRTLSRVLYSKREELFITLVVVFILLVVASSVMYYVESEAQPKAFSSIPASMWWGIATLTTVGYGDIYPITPVGKFVGAIISIMGIGLFALPAGILGSGFVEELQNKKQSKICPHCGKDINEA